MIPNGTSRAPKQRTGRGRLARTWRSLEHDLTISAEHRPGGYVHLTWGIHDRPPSEEWHFETTTVHAAGEEMRNLAAEFHTFLTNTVE